MAFVVLLLYQRLLQGNKRPKMGYLKLLLLDDSLYFVTFVMFMVITDCVTSDTSVFDLYNTIRYFTKHTWTLSIKLVCFSFGL